MFERCAIELAATVGSAATYERTLLVIAELESEGSPVPPVGILQLLLATLENTQMPACGSIPEFADTHERCIRTIIRPLSADPATQELSDELALHSSATQTTALAAAIGHWSHRLELSNLEHIPAGTSKWLNEHTQNELIHLGFEQSTEPTQTATLIRCWEEFMEACAGKKLGFSVEERQLVRHIQKLDSHAKRFAFREVLSITNTFNISTAPAKRPPKELGSNATTLIEPSAYPAGGYEGIGTRGSLESLIHSELLYMDVDQELDWFTARWLNHELLYYTRDDATFQRTHRTFFFALPSTLEELTTIDEPFDARRGLVVLGSIVSLIELLSLTLGTDNLSFEILALSPPRKQDDFIDLLRLRFADSSAVRIQTVDNLSSIPTGATALYWSSQPTHYPRVDLETSTPTLHLTPPSDPDTPKPPIPWISLQSQLLSFLVHS